MPPEPVEDDGAFEEPTDECFLLSLESLARDWDRPEEDAAWAYLQTEHDNREGEAPATP